MKCLIKTVLALSAVLCIMCVVQGAEEDTTLKALTTANEQATKTTTSANITPDVSSTTQAIVTEAVVIDTTTTTTAATTTTATSSTTTTTGKSTTETSKDAQNGNKKYYLSADIPTCQENDVNINDCLKRAFEIMLPRLKDGNKELNLPSIDPFILNRTTFQFSNGPVSGRLTMRKAQIVGLGNTKVDNVDFKIINNNGTKYQMTSIVPLVTISGSYKADIAFNAVRLKPRGIFNVTLTNISMDQTAEGTFYNKDGHRFVHLSKLDIEPKIDGLKIHATGLLPEPTLNDIVVNILNQYWREIYRIMLAETRQYWGPSLLGVINESMASVPFDILIKNV